MKKNILLITCFLFIASAVFGQADKIVGIWVPAKGTSQVRIFKATNGKYYGKVEWLTEDKKDELDVNNPDEKLRDKKVWGLMILKDFVYNDGKKRWDSGTVYDPDNGKTYDCYMWFDGDDNKMTLKGYVLGMKFIGRAEIWTREFELRK
jgi:uncharacterized protein (DUF2147 family)